VSTSRDARCVVTSLSLCCWCATQRYQIAHKYTGSWLILQIGLSLCIFPHIFCKLPRTEPGLNDALVIMSGGNCLLWYGDSRNCIKSPSYIHLSETYWHLHPLAHGPATRCQKRSHFLNSRRASAIAFAISSNSFLSIAANVLPSSRSRVQTFGRPCASGLGNSLQIRSLRQFTSHPSGCAADVLSADSAATG